MKSKILFVILLVIQLKTFSQEVPVSLDSIESSKDTIKYVSPDPFGIPGKKVAEIFKWKSVNNHRNDSIKIFSLSPISRRVKRVNGFALGVGHYENQKIKSQTINGVNIEASPMGLAMMSFAINVPFEAIFVGINDNTISNAAFTEDVVPTYIKVNGLNISSGGFMGGAQMSGVNVSICSSMNKMNGLSFSGVLLATKHFNGVSVSAIANMTAYGNGLQVGISNVSRNHNGLQIGLFNHSNNLRGIQLGLWNTNSKKEAAVYKLAVQKNRNKKPRHIVTGFSSI